MQVLGTKKAYEQLLLVGAVAPYTLDTRIPN